MFDWRFLRGVGIAVAMLAVVLGVLVASRLMLTDTAGPIVDGLAAIGFI
jgi:hypothetical protein